MFSHVASRNQASGSCDRVVDQSWNLKFQVAVSGSNDQNIDFRAYKDVVAFNDIMKSKVKQQARKHKQRKKLDEINMNARSGSKKEVSQRT